MLQSLIIVFILSLSLLSPFLSEAATPWLISSIRLAERFDDNIFSADKDRQHDFVTVISPALELRREGSRLKLVTTYTAHFEVFSRHTELNHGRPHQNLDATLTLNWGRDAKLELYDSFSDTPDQPEFVGGSNVGNILGEGIRIRSNESIRNLACVNLSNVGNVLGEGILTRRNESIRNLACVYLHQPLTEKILFNAQYRNGIKRFEDPSLTDTTRHEVSAGINYEIASWSIPSLVYDYQAVDFETKQAQVHSVIFGYSHAMSPISSAVLSLGAAYPREGDTGYRKTQIIGTFGLQRLMEDGELRVLYSRQVGTSGGFSKELAISNRVSVSLNRNMTQKLTATLIGEYALNKSIVGGAIDIHSFGVLAGAHYRVNPWLSLDVGYSHYGQVSDGSVGTDVVRNQALVSLTVKEL